ncbi:Putative KHG/KDPG aldolase (Includes: 4-hydroxy-2-oxoglutarate aldolase; 2-dehydro-3-deoxy-phosphogluconate aldolase) (modular protein) [uncultured spirochete]|jgi:2-dehydro-3-deoxyphosphogluconate aldolase/(4S)-4-hydroxy-2-oxoglutarate aldolase|uniref:2-dehydro-3-deoxy-phosphogluconate aldolase n=1 Tax=uncultured spirochete TaxID=156406 RepID=A0A3P3XHG1_9SPIR|nr:bifunctional 4-hydroxy-2-oxoglutarate aldolase/2-dehydro-3-deoxy-phosphogluconate aldolase [Rectinema subterraneum]SLM11985.1 Putative KHG/KDPG aldolase (Includes: 4-hydroxy-2-oxoglutarate aldolase; 2-dehydro-3-deoxy-phosphogluconate aldolase) (modular protein) [uncultured spirochete]
MQNLKELFFATGVIPVIKIESAERADGLAGALRAGGLRVAEITFRTKAAAGVIEKFASRHPDIVVGAGTVTTKTEVDSALSSGAKFIVSPGFNPEICAYCIEKKIPVFPGVSNPSLIEQAMSLGLTILKFFPAEVSGGTKALKAFESVYQAVTFIPTGGIQENNLNEYLTIKNVLACGGSWIVPTDLIEAGKFDAITALIQSCRRSMLGFLPLTSEMKLDNASGADADRLSSPVLELKTPSIRRTLAMLGMNEETSSSAKSAIISLGDTRIRIIE